MIRLALLLALAGCRASTGGTGGTAATAPAAPNLATAPSSAAHRTPLDLQALPTTDGSIAIGNLEAQIAGFERAGPSHRRQLISLYETRAQYLGHPDDYAHAEQLAEAVVRESPADGEAYLTRAGAHSSLHRFKEAWADLARAEQLRVKPEHADGLRASLWQATGQEEKALPLRETRARRRPDIDTLGELAALYGQLGRIDEAEAKFAEAQDSYHDVSPFIVAWLYFQEGLMEERAGRLSAAGELYAAAHERLPVYAAASGHLAGVLAARGEAQQALRVLQPLADQLDDPEYAAQYAALQHDEALRAQAGRRYDELVRKYPAAYWDHAARFWIASDPKKALSLARLNLANRATGDALGLLMEAALAAGQPGEASRAADQALTSPRPVALKVTAARAYLGCNQKARGEALLSATASPAPSPPTATRRP